MSNPVLPIFDGHNDVLLRLWRMQQPGVEQAFLDGLEGGHLDLPRARQGGMMGGFFAVYVPSRAPDQIKQMESARYDIPLPPQPELPEAASVTVAMASILLRIAAASKGQVRICRKAAEIRTAQADGALAAVLHIEGAEGIDPEFHMLDVLYAAGLRSIGPVWSRSNIFGHGVPFRFPGAPDTGPGLTDLGKELVRRCNALGIVIDLSHMNEQGFWDVARLSTAPLVATHSNVHALCPSTRNLTPKQLGAIRERRGVVGLNYATCFLRTDGKMTPDTDIELMVRHLDGLLEALGEDGVALGSDFDGAVIPQPIGDVAGVPRLVEALRAHGYTEPLLRKIGHENWISLLERTWGG
jgi:membrane dipeptidase